MAALTLQISSRDYDIVGIGASTMDYFTEVKAFPQGREVQEALSTAADGGGPVSTALAAAARLGSRTIMLDRIGDDLAGRMIMEDFQRYGVHTDLIEIVPGALSGTATILVEQGSGNRAIYFQRATAPELTALRAGEDIIRRSAVLHINGRHSQVLPEAIDIAKSTGTLVSFDGGAGRYSPSVRVLAEKADICIVAKDFAEKYVQDQPPAAANVNQKKPAGKLSEANKSLSSQEDFFKAARLLLENGALIAGITAGAGGSYFALADGTTFHCPAFPMTEVIDTTGCGDSFHGAFLYAITHGYTPQDAAQLASAVGAINTMKIGGRRGLPDVKQAEEFMRKHS